MIHDALRWGVAMVTLAAFELRAEEAVAPAAAPAAAVASRVAPIYSLPKDGTWVEYDFTYKDRFLKPFPGVMRIGSVGRQETPSGPGRWVEVKLQSSALATRIGKFLVLEKAFAAGGKLEDYIQEAFHQEGGTGASFVRKISGKQVYDYFTMGVSGQLFEGETGKAVQTRLGKFTTRTVSSSGLGKLRSAKSLVDDKAPAGGEADAPLMNEHGLEYRAWLTNEAPFGIARFEIWAKMGEKPPQLVFNAEAARKGSGAKSELDEHKAK